MVYFSNPLSNKILVPAVTPREGFALSIIFEEPRKAFKKISSPARKDKMLLCYVGKKSLLLHEDWERIN